MSPGFWARLTPMIQVTNLKKAFRTKLSGQGTIQSVLFPKYQSFQAVDDVSFGVAQGEILGLLGPNGAGKTTIIKILAGLLQPTSGSALIDGMPAERQRARIGLVLGSTMIYNRITGYENLEYYADLYGVDRVKERIGSLAESLGLTFRMGEYVEHYSTGMKAKLAYARALIADPDVLILDEPTLGLDIKVARDIRKAILNSGKTVLITTHCTEEAQELSDRVIILKNGRISKTMCDPQTAEIESGIINEDA